MATITVKSNSKSTSLLAGTESSYSEHFLDSGSIQGTYYCERYGRMVDLSVSLVDKLSKNTTTKLFTLPEEYWPSRKINTTCIAHSGSTIFGESFVTVATDGTVSIDTSVNEFLDHSFNITYIVSEGGNS